MGEQPGFRRAYRLPSGHSEGECTGAERDLGLPRGAAAVPEERRLLIDGARGDFHTIGGGASELTHGRADRRQQPDRHAEQAAQLGVPLPGSQVHEAGARGRSNVGRVDAGHSIQEECVARSQSKAPAAGELRRGGHVVENPLELRGREIRIEGQPGSLERHALGSLGLQPLCRGLGAVVLPDDGIAQRLPAVRIPGDHGLALIRDPDCRGAFRRPQAAHDAGEQLAPIVLDPARPRIDLAVLHCAKRNKLTVRGQAVGLRAGGALVDTDDERHGHWRVTGD